MSSSVTVSNNNNSNKLGFMAVAAVLAASILLAARRSTAFTPVPTFVAPTTKKATTAARRVAALSNNSSNPLSPSDEEGDVDAVAHGTDTQPLEKRRKTLEDEMTAAGGSITLTPIGVVRSVYRLCVGTPRQGLLAPHARARIELTGVVDGVSSVDGLDQFSHVWIVFVFHLNTVGKSGGRHQQSKIAPPSLGGAKIGTLASRSPHRFNPIGMTLAKLDRIHSVEQTVVGRKKAVRTTVLEISGTDLVDGTPVLDIKPYVPSYDAPLDLTTCHVPAWVSEGLATSRSVQLTETAELELRSILRLYPGALEFYGPTAALESEESAYVALKSCIQEVLSMDVRSQYQTSKARNGLSQAERAQRIQPLAGETAPISSRKDNSRESGNDNDSDLTRMCTQQLDNLLLYFTVEETVAAEREASMGSGAEDMVVVHSIRHIGSTL